MGEAIYYAKVKFESQEKAEEALPKIEAFLKRMREAEDRWQETRDGGKAADDARRQEFPAVYDFLKLESPEPRAGIDADYSNYCAGELSSPYGSEAWEIQVIDRAVCFCGMVWHLAGWGRLMSAMVEHFGAIAAGYISDEYAEPDYYALTGV